MKNRRMIVGRQGTQVSFSHQARVYTTNSRILQGFRDTAKINTQMINHLTSIIDKEWDTIKQNTTRDDKINHVEKLIHKTKNNPNPKYFDFDKTFDNVPSYMRRSAMAKAIGHVQAYKSNHENWENQDPKTRGKEPRLGKIKETPVTFYKDRVYKPGKCMQLVKLKLKIGKTWEWVDIHIQTSDAKHINQLKNDPYYTMSCPTLAHKGGNRWVLRFTFTKKVQMKEKDWETSRVCAVDLGVNKAATCVVMDPDGTVVARKFIKFAAEEGLIQHNLNKLRKKQSQGARKLNKSWGKINDLNGELSRKIAKAVVDFAAEHDCDAIACEFLDIKGKIRGSRKFRLHVWRKREVYHLMAAKAHMLGMHVHQVCAWNTSRLAFDGSGPVLRGSEIVDGDGKSLGLSFSRVRFSSGKFYDADLNAALNIAARFYVRGIIKSFTEGGRRRKSAVAGTCGLPLDVNIISSVKGSSVTLSTFISFISGGKALAPVSAKGAVCVG